MWTVTKALLLSLLNCLTGPAGSGSSLGPFQNVWAGLFLGATPPLTPDTNMSQIVEATYHGYARQLIVWYPPFIEATGPYAIEGHSMIFMPTDAAVPNVIAGVFVASAPVGGTYLMGQLLLPASMPLNDPTQAIVYDPIFSLPFSHIYGGADVTN